jgi:DNA polymerase III delta prime subunit
MKSIADILTEHYNNQTLAHFYVIKPSSTFAIEGIDRKISAWTSNLFSKILNGKRMQNHADFLIFQDDEHTILNKEKNYNIEEMEQLNQFLQYKPLSLKYKFILMPSAHLLNELVSNHLLKVLEEPPAFAVFILFNPKNMKLLSTIESRAVNLRIGPNELNQLGLSDQKTIQEIDLTKLQLLSLTDFTEQMKDKETERAILTAIGRKVLQSQQISHHQDYQKLIINYESALAWNDTVYNRYLITYQLIKNL